MVTYHDDDLSTTATLLKRSIPLNESTLYNGDLSTTPNSLQRLALYNGQPSTTITSLQRLPF